MTYLDGLIELGVRIGLYIIVGVVVLILIDEIRKC
jgi:hypothetical protein